VNSSVLVKDLLFLPTFEVSPPKLIKLYSSKITIKGNKDWSNRLYELFRSSETTFVDSYQQRDFYFRGGSNGDIVLVLAQIKSTDSYEIKFLSSQVGESVSLELKLFINHIKRTFSAYSLEFSTEKESYPLAS
jgi:hypothetical protein